MTGAAADAGIGPVTHRRVLRIALPIVLSNATVPLLGAVDTAVVGQLGLAAPIGAVGIGAVILSTLYWAFGFLRMGTSGLTAQAKGAGAADEETATLLRALAVAGLAGLGLIALQSALFAAAFALAPASAEVEDLARTYLAIRIWGAPATIGLYAITGWLIGREATRGVLTLQLAMNLVNIALDLWFVLGLGWGVEGVALATLIAEYLGLVLGLWLTRGAFGSRLAPALARLRDAVALRRMLVVNRDIMGRSVLLTLAFTAFMFLSAGFGDTTLAANQVLNQFLSISAFALDGIAFASETLIGQAVGGRDAPGARRAARLTMAWGFAGAGLMAAAFALFHAQILGLMTTSPEVLAEARHFLPWLIAAPVIGVASWIYDGIFIGATLTREMLRAMVLSVAIYVLALLVLIPIFGNHGLWAALMLFLVARAVTLNRSMPALHLLAGGASTGRP